MPNKLLFRVIAIALHLFLNFIVVSCLMAIDWTGSWLRFFLFIVLLLVLLILFVRHLFSFIVFLKTKS